MSTRRSWILIGTLALAALGLFAGESLAARGEAGVLGGMNMATLGGDADQFGEVLRASVSESAGNDWSLETGRRLTVGGGGYVAFEVARGVFVQAELDYMPRGIKYSMAGTVEGYPTTMDVRMKLDYLELPLLVRVSPVSEGSLRPMLLAGPVAGLKVSSKLGVSASAGGATQEVSQDMSGGLKSTYLGMIFGAGVEFPAGERTTLMLQGRYTLGLTNVLDDPNFNMKVGDFHILAGIGFHFDLKPKGQDAAPAGATPAP
ncbi:MAG TPA: porin family protein [Candidatus Saccharimonadales bacterium]|nr:porin family protein [Candidatus Saccharimonadales bacterium]